MQMNVQADKVATEAGVEPLTLTELKTMLGVRTSDHDDYLTDMITSAREFAESRTNLALIESTVTATISHQMRFVYLPYAPIKSITSIKNYNSSGIEIGDLTEGSHYDLRSPDNTEMHFLQELPSYHVKVVYTAGFTTVPKIVKTVVEKLCRFWYDEPDKVMLYNDKASEILALLRTISKRSRI